MTSPVMKIVIFGVNTLKKKWSSIAIHVSDRVNIRSCSLTNYIVLCIWVGTAFSIVSLLINKCALYWQTGRLTRKISYINLPPTIALEHIEKIIEKGNYQNGCMKMPLTGGSGPLRGLLCLEATKLLIRPKP